METKKSALSLLTETNDVRIEEDMIRPRVEMYFDDWAAWASWHRARDEGREFSPHFGIGWN